MEYQMVCDCPYTFAGGCCVNEKALIEGPKICRDCPYYKNWYNQL
jgi:hypothetical protein